MSTTTTLLTLPFLAIISIPLIITASITIFFSVITLSLQLSVITIELCVALITNLFTIPPSPNWSLLSFSVSSPTTPHRRRSSDYGILQSPLAAFRSRSQSYSQLQSLGQSQGQAGGRPSLGPRMGSSNVLLDSPEQDISPETRWPQSQSQSHVRANHNHNHNSQTYSSHKRNSSAFLGLINGEEDRDFEGLGGWRCPPSYTKSPAYRSGRTTPSSGNSDEIDDIAWVSMNSRLELPSQPLMLRHSGSSTHNLYACNYNHSCNDSPVEPHLPRRKSSRAGLSAAVGLAMASLPEPKRAITGSQNQNQGNGRHHRRSATTSALSDSKPGLGHSLSLSTSPTSTSQFHRPNHRSGNGLTTMQARGDALRSKSHTSLSEHWGSRSGSVSSGGGYFPIQAMSSETGVGAGTQTTSNTTPSDERKPARMTSSSRSQGGSPRARRVPISRDAVRC